MPVGQEVIATIRFGAGADTAGSGVWNTAGLEGGGGAGFGSGSG